MAELTREQRMQMRGEVERRRGDPGYTGIFYIGDADLLSLLDAADERDRLREARTWLMFAGSDYYPRGGVGDFVGSFVGTNTSAIYRSAMKKAAALGCDWWNLLCAETDERLDGRQVAAILQYEEDTADAPL